MAAGGGVARPPHVDNRFKSCDNGIQRGSLYKMGKRGHTIHVLDGRAHDALLGVGHRVAVLGTNERWTSFVPMDASMFDCRPASKALDRAILQAWFDDDLGVVIRVFSSGAFVGELALPGEADGEVTEADGELVEKLVELEVLSRVQRATLLKRMSNANGLRAWTMKHGVEKLLDLPFYDPMPSHLPESQLRTLLPEAAMVLEPATANRTKTKARKPKGTVVASLAMSPPKVSWNERESATVDLHSEYWSTVFSMNNWKLYNRYKKHLPADQRRNVDELCNAVAMGNDDVADRVRGILARVWECEDWNAVIREPKLIDGDDDVWRAWLKHVSA